MYRFIGQILVQPLKAWVRASAVSVCLLTGVSAHAALMMPDLGIAGKFNAFILGDMQGYHSDVEGRLAVGGDLTLENYSIGLQLSNSRGKRDDLIVRDNATFTNGRIYSGNAVVGGDNNIDSQYNENDPDSGSVGLYRGENPSDPSGTVIESDNLPLNFDQIGNELRTKSEAWGDWTPNGTVTKDEHGNIQFTGEGKKAVFNLCDGDTEQQHALCENGLVDVNSFLFDIPRYTTAIINVFNTDVTLSHLGFHHMAIARRGENGELRGEHNKMPDNQPRVFRHNGELTNRILFNFVNATSLNMNAIGFKGSVLAPKAAVNFYNGHIDGNLIGGSLTAPDLSGMTWNHVRDERKELFTAGQFNNYRFMDVPAPSTLSAFALGLLLLGFRTRRSRRCALPA